MDQHPIQRTTCARIPTPEGVFQLCHYSNAHDGKEHLALVMGEVADAQGVLVRVHSECFTGDVLGSQRCDCGEQLHQAMRLVAQAGQGVIIYLRQEGRGIGLADKLRAYNLQDRGYDTVEANLMLGHQADEREYSAAAAILHELEIASIRLMTNNPAKLNHLKALGITIVGRVPLTSTVTPDNAAYLTTKVRRMHHLLTMPTNSTTLASPNPIGYTNGTSVEYRLDALRRRAADYFATTGRPFVTLSYAQGLDGTIGSPTRGPLAISGPQSMRLTHALRAQHDAILVGIGTVLADDPRLTVRLVDGPQPQPVIVDSHARLPLDAQLWRHPKAPWLATSQPASAAAEALARRGARIIPMPVLATSESPEETVDLDELLTTLGESGITSVMVEGGARILASFLSRRLAQAAVITVAPRFLGGVGITVHAPTAPMPLDHVEYTQAGQDLVLWGDFSFDTTHLLPDQTAWLMNHPSPHPAAQ